MYTTDSSLNQRIIEVHTEKFLILTCLGPPESEWHNRNFKVCRNGVIGGRGHLLEEAMNGKDIVQFTDLDVSRRHFEVF